MICLNSVVSEKIGRDPFFIYKVRLPKATRPPPSLHRARKHLKISPLTTHGHGAGVQLDIREAVATTDVATFVDV